MTELCADGTDLLQTTNPLISRSAHRLGQMTCARPMEQKTATVEVLSNASMPSCGLLEGMQSRFSP